MKKAIKIPPYANAIKVAFEILKKGGVMIYPTDTIYGIGADATKPKAIKRIMKIKRRKNDAFSVMLRKEDIKKYCIVPSKYLLKINKLLPGPYTFLLKARKNFVFAKDKIVGVRVPKNKFCLELLEKFKKPIISTSANISGKKSNYCVEDIEKEIKNKVDLIIDGGPTKYKIGSTIIDIPNKKIVRIGAGYKKVKKMFRDFL